MYLIISRESSSIIVGVLTLCGPCFSSNKGKSFGDHMAVQFVVNIDKPNCIRIKITHKYRCINIK